MDAFDALVAEATRLAEEKRAGKKRSNAVKKSANTPRAVPSRIVTQERRMAEESAVALCTVIQEQYCLHCGQIHEAIGGQFVVMQSPLTRHTRHVAMAAISTTHTLEEISSLPFSVDRVRRDVAFCPDCLQFGMTADRLINLADAEQWPAQLPLWRQ